MCQYVFYLNGSKQTFCHQWSYGVPFSSKNNVFLAVLHHFGAGWLQSSPKELERNMRQKFYIPIPKKYLYLYVLNYIEHSTFFHPNFKWAKVLECVTAGVFPVTKVCHLWLFVPIIASSKWPLSVFVLLVCFCLVFICCCCCLLTWKSELSKEEKWDNSNLRKGGKTKTPHKH